MLTDALVTSLSAVCLLNAPHFANPDVSEAWTSTVVVLVLYLLLVMLLVYHANRFNHRK